MNFLIHPDDRPKPKPWHDDLIKKTKIVNVEIKEDGYRFLIQRDKEGNFFAANRLAEVNWWSDLEECPLFKRAEEFIPPGTVIDGELHVLGYKATDVRTHIIARSSLLTMTVLAIPWFNGKVRRDMTFDKRDAIVDQYFTTISPLVKKPTCVFYKKNYESLRTLELNALAEKLEIEGFVLKEKCWPFYNKDYPYRNRGWWKTKPTRTVDAFVTGVKSGSGKFTGQIGSLEVSVWDGRSLVTIASVGKGNDDQWRHLTRQQVVGRVCEVQYEEVQAKGKLKFSSFVRWRTDKLQQDCFLDQIL